MTNETSKMRIRDNTGLAENSIFSANYASGSMQNPMAQKINTQNYMPT